MSYKAYEIFTVQPDFTRDPFMGIGDPGRTDLRIGMKPGYSEWTGTTALAFSFLFRTRTPEENTTLREFLFRFKGRWAAFFLPSWQQDFALAMAASIGDTTLTVSEEGFAELTENRPDTEKRVIFALTTDGILQTWNILSAADSGGDEIVTLDTPVTTALDPETTMMGYCYLVRLADDRQEWTYDAPGQGSVDLTFVTVRNKRTVETEEIVESAAIGDLKAAVNLLATNEDPELLEFLSPEATGPTAYNVTQAANYSTPWEARFFDATTIEMEQLSSGVVTASALYDGSVASDHLAFCFDSASQEVLAWNHTTMPGKIRLRYYAGGLPQALDFTGFSPVAYNTWVIDSTVTLGAAETVIFYLKPGYSVIFARFESESYAIEYQFLRSPSAPIYLHKAVKNVNVIEIHGMDSGHRKIVWNSDIYRPPEVDEALATMSLAGGTYELIAIATDPEADAQSATIVFSGEYVNLVRSTDPEADGQSATIVFSGEYVNSVRSTDPETDVQSSTLVFSSSGGYTLIAKSTGAETDVQSSTLTFPTGSYEIP